MSNTSELPYIAEVVACLVNARFQDSITMLNTAQNIHDCLLVPCPIAEESPIFAFYPPLRAALTVHPLTIAPEVQAFITRLTPFGNPSIFARQLARDPLFLARVRLIEAYRQALIQRTRRIAEDTTRIDAPFPPLTLVEQQERVAYVVERAITIPIPQTVDWWADVTCGVALTSPSETALATLTASHPDGPPTYRTINSWRQIGYIIENLQR